MIKFLNITAAQSNIIGWRVALNKTDQNIIKPRLVLEGTDSVQSRIGLNIHPKDYEKLTTPAGVDIYAPCKLISIEDNAKSPSQYSGEKSLIPYLVEATEDEDTSLLLLHFEPGIGESIYDVKLDNCESIAHFINSEPYKTAITISLINIDQWKPSSICIDYCYLGGLTVIRNIIRFGSRTNSKFGIEIENDNYRLDIPAAHQDIVIPKFDLSKVLINEY